jgi:hypothetical protein
MMGLSDQEFHVWLNALERGEELPAALPADDAADLVLARRLLALRAAPSPHLASQVEQMVVAPWLPRRLSGTPARRWAGAGIIAALVLMSTLALTPAGSWAQTVLERFGVIFLPGAIPQWSASLPEITPTQSPVAFRSEGEVQAAASFPLHWPADFPFDRKRATFLGYMVHTEDGAWIESLYGDDQQRYLEIQVFWRQRPGPWPVGDARFKPVSVSGHSGLWGESVPASFTAGARSSLTLKSADGTQTRVGSAAASSLGPINMLLWEEGEVLYVLVDPNQQFSQADMLRTAESAY